MVRSFTDRIFGGVCGGLALVLPLNAWVLRFTFAILSLITGGVFAAFYLFLWWWLPQESLAERRRGGSGRLLLIIILALLTILAWLASLTGNLKSPTGQDLLWPLIILLLSIVFFFKQVRA